MSRLSRLLSIYLSLVSVPLCAQVEYSGFVNLGISFSDSDQYGYRQVVSADEGAYQGSPDWHSNTLLGLQAEYSATNNLEFVGQAILKERHKADWHDYISLAFARYQANANWRIRAGRIPLDLFLMAPYRNISYSYISHHPAVEFYGIVPNEHLDGLEVTYFQPIGLGTLKYKGFYGVSDAYLVSNQFDWNIQFRDIRGINFEYEQLDWLLRANYVTARFGNSSVTSQFIQASLKQVPESVWPNRDEISNKVAVNKKSISYATLSARYDNGTWYHQGEFSYIDSTSDTIKNLRNAYLESAYRFNRHTPFIRFSVTSSPFRDVPPPGPIFGDLARLYDAINFSLNFYATNQRTWALGYRYELTDTMALKAQFNRTHVEEKSDRLLLRSSPYPNAETFQTLHLGFSWVF